MLQEEGKVAVKKEGLIKSLALKLEALDKAILEINEDIEEESNRKVEAEKELAKFNQELKEINPGDTERLQQVGMIEKCIIESTG